MKVVLFAVGGSFSHTNLAVRCLRAPLERAGFEVVLIEGNLRDRRDELLQSLYRERADIYGFSVYIWNLSLMLSLGRDLKALLPNSKWICGGPEVSFDTERFADMDCIDHIIAGEGEEALPALCKSISAGERAARVITARPLEEMPREGILYRDDDGGGDMLYYESSRGCPYACAYCLSSAMGGVRAKSAEETLAELLQFECLARPVRVIKFVDRTFNFDKKRAAAIWRGLLDEKYTKCYHFEICASLLDEECFTALAQLPKGKVQLEIGLQSTCKETLAAVARHMDAGATIAATKRLYAMGNIHIHLDLIAGLPYESYARFAESFNDAYGYSHMLQLGFLKLLHGTAMRENADEHGYIYMAEPPYTVLENRYISRDELYRLSRIDRILERFHGSGRFERSLALAVPAFPSPFAFYEGLADFILQEDGRAIEKIAQPQAFGLLYRYAIGAVTDKEAWARAIHEDYAAHETRALPASFLTKK